MSLLRLRPWTWGAEELSHTEYVDGRVWGDTKKMFELK